MHSRHCELCGNNAERITFGELATSLVLHTATMHWLIRVRDESGLQNLAGGDLDFNGKPFSTLLLWRLLTTCLTD